MRRVKCIKRADYEPSPAFCHGWMSELSSFFAANSLITMSGFSDQSCRLAGHLVHPMFVLFFIADSLLMTDSFFHIDPADNIGLDRHWFAFFHPAAFSLLTTDCSSDHLAENSWCF